MRVAGYIDLPACKCTVFQQGMRFTVKFEDGLYEQSFKFRMSEEIASVTDLQKLMDDSFIDQVMQRFEQMRTDMNALMLRHFSTNDEEFEEEEII